MELQLYQIQIQLSSLLILRIKQDRIMTKRAYGNPFNITYSNNAEATHYISDLLNNLTSSSQSSDYLDRNAILSELSQFDTKVSEMYFKQNRTSLQNQTFNNNYSTISFQQNDTIYNEMPDLASQLINKTVKLKVPKNNSLTDSMLRTVLGSEQKLSKSYMQLLTQSTSTEQQDKQKRIQQAKKRFAESNGYKDTYANSKTSIRFVPPQNLFLRPVIENEHDSYLKTQLTYLGSKKNKQQNATNSSEKYLQTVTKKISEIGGMEDTIGRMEDSLSKHQIKNFKKRALLKQSMGMGSRNNPFSPPKVPKSASNKGLSDSNYFQRSKNIRQTLMNKINS